MKNKKKRKKEITWKKPVPVMLSPDWNANFIFPLLKKRRLRRGAGRRRRGLSLLEYRLKRVKVDN